MPATVECWNFFFAQGNVGTLSEKTEVSFFCVQDVQKSSSSLYCV